MVRRTPALALLLLAACAEGTPQPAVVGNVPPPPPSRFDGDYRGTATRSYGSETDCGPLSRPMALVVAQGRAIGSLPGQGEARGVVSADGGLTLRANLDAAQRATGRISDSFQFTARFQTRLCAWDLRLNRGG